MLRLASASPFGFQGSEFKVGFMQSLTSLHNPPNLPVSANRSMKLDFDASANFCYYRARYYDPNIGRFISEDRFRFWGGIDFYAYVHNAPIDLADPLGLSPKPKVPFRWRECTTSEEAFCIEQCAKQGKRFESCRVSQTYRIKSLKHGPDWYDYVGDPSCSCEDPDPDHNIKCKELQQEPLKKRLDRILRQINEM